MKSLRWFAVVVCFVVVSIALIDIVSAAPSLPITKPPVTGTYLTGPVPDPSSTNGQWFLDIASGGEEYRTHEFYDNLKTDGGGHMDQHSISGYVSRVVITPGTGEITEFDITATIFNDAALDNLGWMAGSNSHFEVNNNQEDHYYGALIDTKLTVEFAISSHDSNIPTLWIPPYHDSPGEYIIATNENQLGWYCWNPDEQEAAGMGGFGDYHVPTWDFGDIPVNSSSTRILKFVVSGAGIDLADPRHTIISISFDQKLDILLNRTTSLKISTWIDTLAIDAGAPYPHLEGGDPARSSDVSVFHNEEDLDFGDAPYDILTNTYETLLLHNGARHAIYTNIMMGSKIDSEPDGQPSIGAILDDTVGVNDEDGVKLTSGLYPGMIASVDVTVSVGGFINAWIDFGSNGTWAEAGDYIIVDQSVVAGTNHISFSVPASAPPITPAYARFRFTTAPGIAKTVTGYAPDGEVEDYMWQFRETESAKDYGDAPNTYLTLAASGGAVHNIGATGPWLGDSSNNPDPDLDGQPDASALGDDSDGNNDEQGVQLANGTKLITDVPTSYNVEVNGGGGVFQMWIDWDQNGTFDHPIEMVEDIPLPDGSHSLWVTAPLSATAGSTFIRCRISTVGLLGPAGAASDGEIEDYTLIVTNGYVNWGNLQQPAATTTYVGTASVDIYGQCWHDGLTPPSTNAAPGLVAQIGYGPDGSDTPWDGNWTWFNATFNSQTGNTNNDEYVGIITIGTAGTYDYAYRYSLNSTEWTYGDIDGSNNGYTNTQAGDIVVTTLSPFSITNIAMVATSDTATVMWDAEARVVYQLQYVTELPTNIPPWSNIGGQVTGPTNTQTDTTATTTRFYRVVAPYAK